MVGSPFSPWSSTSRPTFFLSFFRKIIDIENESLVLSRGKTFFHTVQKEKFLGAIKNLILETFYL